MMRGDELRPTCLNEGCNSPCTNSGTRWRPFCQGCHVKGFKNLPLAEGKTKFKKGRCANQDGRLGFTCAIDYNKAPWAIGQTQIDHINGNHLENTPDNCMELCDMCHTHKGKLTGDFKNQTPYKYKRG